MKKLYLIGIGPGDPRYLTIQAIETLQIIDVFLFLEKEGRGKEDLLQIRRDILQRYRSAGGYRIVTAASPVRSMSTQAENYQQDVRTWHEQKRILFMNWLNQELSENETGGLLLWGDPSLYDQTISLITEIAQMMPESFTFEIIPGITAVQALTARHKIPLNRVGETITITTGRHVEMCDPDSIDNAVVLLDYNSSFQRFQGQKMDIYWGGNLGQPDEKILAGPVDQIYSKIIETKTQLRATKGWMMDVYLLRRRLQQPK